MSFSAILADDEEMARSRLRRLLGEHCKDVEIIDECEDGLSTRDRINALKPDLVFLDVEMGGMNGIEVALSTDHKPFVIFVTAYSHYAIDAFKTLAVDYILKPVDGEGLAQAVAKFRRLVSPPDLTRLLGLLSENSKTREHQRFHVTVGETTKLIPLDQIICFEADQKFTTVHVMPSTTYLTEKTLAELESTLPREIFMRIHRKHIVNANYVKEVTRWFDRKLKLVLNVPFEKDLFVSRGYLSNLENL